MVSDALELSRETSEALVESNSQREIAEVQAAVIMARRFPRNQKLSLERILSSCGRKRLAEEALYSYHKGGTEVTGPSIRLAEALAQNWGNVQFGVRELEARAGASTVEAYAWDLETNVRQTRVFQVAHKRFARGRSHQLEDPRDIYELVANQGARRVRACILGIIPGDVVDAAVERCESTLRATTDNTPEALTNLVDAFSRFGVTKAQLETRVGCRIDAIRGPQLVQLRKIYQSLRDGMSSPRDWFQQPETGAAAADSIAQGLGREPGDDDD